MNELEIVLSELKNDTYKFKREKDFQDIEEKEHMRSILINQIEKQLGLNDVENKEKEKNKKEYDRKEGYEDVEYKGKKLSGTTSYEKIGKAKYIDKNTGEVKYGKINPNFKNGFVKGDEQVYVTVAGNHVEVCSINGKEIKPPSIKKISKTQYEDLKTGEIRDFQVSDNRSQNTDSFRKSMKRLRGIIKANFYGESNELFVTLTYAEQTNDYKKVYSDTADFVRRLKRHCASSRKKRVFKDLPVSDQIEYINVVEPHETGCFHCHILLKFHDVKKVFIPNEVSWLDGVPTTINSPLRELWGMGNITIKSLKGNDDIGAYMSAYMTDLQVPDDYNKPNENLVEKEVEGKKKKYIKGGRVAFYPSGMNIFSKSGGIIIPKKELMKYDEIEKVVGSAKPHYQSKLLLENENKITTIKHEQYNLKRQGNKYKGIKKVEKEMVIDKR